MGQSRSISEYWRLAKRAKRGTGQSMGLPGFTRGSSHIELQFRLRSSNPQREHSTACRCHSGLAENAFSDGKFLPAGKTSRFTLSPGAGIKPSLIPFARRNLSNHASLASFFFRSASGDTSTGLGSWPETFLPTFRLAGKTPEYPRCADWFKHATGSSPWFLSLRAYP